MATRRKNAAGFILMELITTIILIGIIGTFVGFFLYTGFSGYLVSKQTNEGALRAQIALDRIGIELRDIQNIASCSSTAMTYTNSNFLGTDGLPETRTISYDSNTNRVFIAVAVSQYLLLDRVSTFTLSKDGTRDLDGDGTFDVAGITVSITLEEIGRQLTTTIFPRNLVANP